MANKKISQLSVRTPSLTDLMLIGDPSTGFSYKATISEVSSVIESAIGGNYVTLATTQTISGAKTFSNTLTLSSVTNASTDTDKFVVLDGGVIKYRTGTQVLSDIGGVGGSGTTNYVPKFTSSSAIGNSQIYDNGTNVLIGTTTDNGNKLQVNGNVLTYGKFVLNGNGADGETLNIKQYSTTNVLGSGYTSLSATTDSKIGVYFGQSGGSKAFNFDVTGMTLNVTRNYTMPNADGTLALTSDIPSLSGYVPYTGATSNVNLGSYNLTANNVYISNTLRLTQASSSDIQAYTGSAYSNLNYDAASHNWQTSGGTAKMVLNASGNLGLGVTPSAWNLKGFDIDAGGAVFGASNNIGLTNNAYYNSGWIYKNTATAGNYIIVGNEHRWNIAPSGTAGNAISFTQAMTLFSDGNLALNTTANAGYKLDVNGTGRFSSSTLTLVNSGSYAAYNVGDGTYASYFGYAQSGGQYVNNSQAGDAIVRGYNGVTIQGGDGGGGYLRISSTGAATFSSSVQTYRLKLVEASSSTNFTLYTGVNNSNSIGFYNETSGAYNLVINPSGNVGIGTSSPISYSGYNVLTIAGNTNGGVLAIRNSGGYGINLSATGNAATIDAIDNSAPLVLTTNSTERMRITSGGNVGIGTSAPNTKLHIEVANPTNGIIQTIRNSSSSSQTGSQIHFVQESIADWVIGQPAATDAFAIWSGRYPNAAGTERMRITSGGDVLMGTSTSPGYGRTTASIYNSSGGILQVAGSSTTALFYVYQPDNLANIGTTTNHAFAFITNGSERMRITSGGNVLVGTTSNPMTSNSDATLMMSVPNGNDGISIKSNSNGSNVLNIWQTGTSGANAVAFYKGNTQTSVGSIGITTTGTSYNTTSDYRLKQDLKDFNGLSLLDAMKIYDFKWKSDNTRSYGVLAHELQEILSYAVVGEKDGEQMQGVDYSKLVPILVKAIQELNNKIK